MRRFRFNVPVALGLTGLLSISAACEMEYESVVIEDIDADQSHFEWGGGGWGATDEEDENGDDNPGGVIIFQSRWLRAPRSAYVRTPKSGLRHRVATRDRWGNPTTAPVRNLKIESNQLRGTADTYIQNRPSTGPIFQNGWKPAALDVRGKDFKGATVSMEFQVAHLRRDDVDSERDYVIRDVKRLSEFALHERTLPLHVSVNPSEMYVYKLETRTDYDKDGRPDGLLCGEAPHYDPENRLWQYAVAVPVEWSNGERVPVPGSNNTEWIEPGQARATPSTGKFTFACLNSAAAKCRLWGYELRTASSNGAYEKKSLAAVNACTRMVMADYCGSGKPYTLDGTAINFADDQEINSVAAFDPATQPTHPDGQPTQSVEAMWGAKGAYCMSNYRIKNSKKIWYWSNGKPIEVSANPTRPNDGADQFCGGETPYGRPLTPCDDEEILAAELRDGDFGYDSGEDVVISNSSEAEYWITAPAEDDWLTEITPRDVDGSIDPSEPDDDTSSDDSDSGSTTTTLPIFTFPKLPSRRWFPF